MSNLKAMAIGALVAVASLGGAAAQEGPPVLPVELFLCNYRPGNDAGDLERVNTAYNRWADSRNLNSITSLVLTPSYHSDQLEYDVIGMDIWENGAAMGRGSAMMRSPGSPIPDFDEVVDCPAHQMFALVGIKPPPGESDTAIFEFSNCTVKENRSADDGIAAVGAVAQMWTDWNVGDAHAVLFPVAGEAGDATYTFKWITRYPSYEAYGSVFDHYAAGAVAAAERIISPVMTCDSSRIYDATTIRAMQGGN
jgi:hypothetical protein